MSWELYCPGNWPLSGQIILSDLVLYLFGDETPWTDLALSIKDQFAAHNSDYYHYHIPVHIFPNVCLQYLLSQVFIMLAVESRGQIFQEEEWKFQNIQKKLCFQMKLNFQYQFTVLFEKQV